MCSSYFQFVGVKSLVDENLGDLDHTCIFLWKPEGIECVYLV